MFRLDRITAIVITCLLVIGCTAAAPTRAPTQPDDHHRWPLPPPREEPEPEPVATPPRGVTFEDAGVNPFRDPLRNPLSTFAMDVDTASYSIARRYLDDNMLPPRDSVRLEEYVNSFDYGYRPPANDAFAVHVDGAPTPFTGRSLLLRIGIQARTIDDADRSPVSLTFVIDTSGSMKMENRLEVVKEALAMLVRELRADDSVAIVEFGSSAQVVLNPTSAAEPDEILHAIALLQPGGSTNAQAGLELGYDIASLGHRRGALDRVVLASDGVANVGLTQADAILRRVDREVESGVDLVAIGVGLGNFNDVLLEQLANRGNGFYAYINDRRDAERLFRHQLTGTLQLVARDAKVQVEFRPEAVARYRLLGYENRTLSADDFRDPTVDAGEVGAGHSVTALYEIELAELGRDSHLGTVRLRWADADTRRGESLERDIDLADTVRDWSSADPEFRLAATVAGMAEILRDSPSARGYSLADVAAEAGDLARMFDGREDVADFLGLARAAARLER